MQGGTIEEGHGLFFRTSIAPYSSQVVPPEGEDDVGYHDQNSNAKGAVSLTRTYSGVLIEEGEEKEEKGTGPLPQHTDELGSPGSEKTETVSEFEELIRCQEIPVRPNSVRRDERVRFLVKGRGDDGGEKYENGDNDANLDDLLDYMVRIKGLVAIFPPFTHLVTILHSPSLSKRISYAESSHQQKVYRQEYH